ncbi:MAG: hypothetical protein DRH79_08205 [Candidatus Cloacimonadota bacterium]|nr:MAG: hypothetical protein DRH79_08205 [Candidatus Cloacimonadota bacterium]
MIVFSFLLNGVKRIPVWVWLFLVGVCIFCTSTVAVSMDLGAYMNYALNILKGKGYVDMSGHPVFIRAPLFPLMIAVSFRMLGISVSSAFWIVRFFAILNPLLIYFLGKKIGGKWLGVTAAFLALSSYSLNFWSYRHLDAVWPSFVLISLIVLYSAFEASRLSYFILSGMFMGLAYLVKQAALIFFPLPVLLLLFIRTYRNRKNIRGVLLYLLFISAFVLPWVHYVYFHTSNWKFALLGRGGGFAADAFLHLNLFTVFERYLHGLVMYYSGGDQSLVYNFSLAPLFLLSWAFVLFKGIGKRDKDVLILTVIFLLISPYLSFVGNNNLRVGQLVIFILLSYLVAAYFIVEMIGRLCQKLHFPTKMYTSLNMIVLIIGIIFQCFFSYKGDKGDRAFLKQSVFIGRFLPGEISQEILGLYGEKFATRKVAKWICGNLSPEEKIMIDWPAYARPVYFYTEGSYRVYNMPIHGELFDIYGGWNKVRSNLILLSAGAYLRCDPRNRFYYLTEGDLLRVLKEYKIKYILISPERFYLLPYFEKNPSFIKVTEMGKEGPVIFRVKAVHPLKKFQTIVTRYAFEFLKCLKNNPQRYEYLKKELFLGALGWKEEQFDQFIKISSQQEFR